MTSSRRYLPLVLAAAAAACSRSPHIVSDGPTGSYEAALARAGDGLVAGWYDTRDGNGEIYIRQLDAEGRAAGPERRLTTSEAQSYEVSLASVGAHLAVAWYDRAADGVLTASVGLWDAGDNRTWAVTLGTATRNPVVRSHRGRVFCAWIGNAADGTPSVWTRWWDAAGTPLGAPVLVGAAGKTTWNLNAAIDDAGVAWVVYDATAKTRADELFLARIDGADVSLARVSADDGVASKYPDLAIEGGRAAFTWYDARDGNEEVYLAVVPLGELSAGVERAARRVTASAGESIGAYVAWNRRTIGLAWSDNTSGQHEVYVQRFSEAGEPSGDAQRITSSAASSLIPAIVPWGRGFALAWNEYTAPDDGAHSASGRSHIAATVVP